MFSVMGMQYRKKPGYNVNWHNSSFHGIRTQKPAVRFTARKYAAPVIEEPEETVAAVTEEFVLKETGKTASLKMPHRPGRKKRKTGKSSRRKQLYRNSSRRGIRSTCALRVSPQKFILPEEIHEPVIEQKQEALHEETFTVITQQRTVLKKPRHYKKHQPGRKPSKKIYRNSSNRGIRSRLVPVTVIEETVIPRGEFIDEVLEEAFRELEEIPEISDVIAIAPEAATAKTDIRTFALGLLGVFVFSLLLRSLMPAAHRVLGTKLAAQTQLSAQLNITEAEPVRELGAYVELESFREPLEEYVSNLSGDWAVYIMIPETGEELAVNDHQMPSASLIKLFTAGCYLEEAQAGRIQETNASEANMKAMISVSDNDAWQRLETHIGHGSYTTGLNMVTSFAKNHGYKDTGRLIGGESIYSSRSNNLTSVSDVGRVLYEIYTGTYVSERASKKILDCMLSQVHVSKIPAGLPEGIKSANKTGELTGIENDAGIVWGLNCTYIVVIMSNQNTAGTRPVADLSAYIYQYLNPGSLRVLTENME